MAAKKSGKKMKAGGRAVGGQPKEIVKKFGERIAKGRNATASRRQTRATSKGTDTRNGIISSSPEVVKQSSEYAKPGRVRKVKSVQEVMKDGEKSGRLEKSRTRRACTLSERPTSPRYALIREASGNEDDEIKENCLPSTADSHWTQYQEKALIESLSTIKPGVNFWRLIAERVPGRSAEDCFEKFYSGRTTTRAAKRSRTEEVDSTLAKRNGSKRVKTLQSNTPMNVKTPGREMRTIRQAAEQRPARKESKICGKGHNAGAVTRQTIATSQGTKRRVGGASKTPDVEQIGAKKQDCIEKAKDNRKVGQRARKGSKSTTGKQDLVEEVEVRLASSTPGVALASGFDRSPISDDGDKQIESPSDFMDSDLWTSVQESALQDAYSTIRPSANFWHLISKRVPGRSAEECFNKFYSAHPTPPRAVAQRSCLKEVDCPLSLSNHRHPPKSKTKGGKRLLEAHRTVRNILRRQQVDDEDYEADAFAALEPPDVVHSVMEKAKDDEASILEETSTKFSVYFSRPGSTENSTTRCAKSDKENRKPKAVGGRQLTDFGISTQSQVFSPEILKRVKDPLMLDKYIDHLHQRRTRRPGTKSAKKNAKRASEGNENHSKDGLDFREVRMNAIHRAKQELRDVFLRPGSAVDEPFLDLLNDSTDDDKEEDDESMDTQMDL